MKIGKDKMTNTAARSTEAKWPVRFGTMTRLALKQGKSGQYALITVQCKGFTQSAICFNADVIAKMKAAGEGARVWFKGPIESVQKTGYSEDQMKVIYFSASASAEEDATPVAEEADVAAAEEVAVEVSAEFVGNDDLTQINGVGPAVAAKLEEAGIRTFAALAEMSDADLDALGAGTAKRATTKNWRGQARALTNVGAAEVAEEVLF
jgi:predicted flap endonuclease-1-like 5' DNA nuclease